MVEHPTLPDGTWDQTLLAAVPDDIMNQASPPQLIVTNSGSVLKELAMVNPRLLIGRSEHNDISINSRFISRHHVLLARNGGATFLMDLNSTNGTFVNARRVSNQILRHNDVITVGHHRIKFKDPYAQTRGEPDPADFADTAIMKSLQDMRSLLAQENTELLPAATEDLPTVRS
jgi:pSer/pThr/pTyr-binding forkhead associated (FHA) protein